MPPNWFLFDRSTFLKEYECGETPNPDIHCNKHIKFNAFYHYARETLSADAIAMGHYARSSYGTYLENYSENTSENSSWITRDSWYITNFRSFPHCKFSDAKLLRAVDTWKDQTFFLSQIPQKALRRTMFPLGYLLKADVKRIASDAGLATIAQKKESMGICFVGKRPFKDFMAEYIAPKPGTFVDIDTGKVIGEHNGFHNFTIGQSILKPGMPRKIYVLRKMPDGETILVAGGSDNPAFFFDMLFTKEPHWIDRSPFDDGTKCVNVVDLKFCFQHIKPLEPCNVTVSNGDRGLLVKLHRPLRAIAPGQYAVLYRNEECLGSAQILAPGPSQRLVGAAVIASDANNAESTENRFSEPSERQSAKVQ